MNTQNSMRNLGARWAVGVALWSVAAWGQTVPGGMKIQEDTLSPDHRYGVLVPLIDEDSQIDDPRNKLVEAKTGKVIAVINAETGYDHMNHGGVQPSQWSKDSTLLLWQVAGKWFPTALVLLKVEDGVQKWQVDLLKSAQQECLARVRKQQPKMYAHIKTTHAKTFGSAYPDGFTIDVKASEGEPSLPLKISAELTSDPKELEPVKERLEASLEAEVDADGKFKVTKFSMSAGGK